MKRSGMVLGSACLIGVFLVASASASPRSAPADEERQEQLADALRERRLTRVWELQIRRRLKNSSSPVAVRAGLVRELAGLLSARGARSLDAPARQAAFAEADKLTLDFIAENPNYPALDEFRYYTAGQVLERAQQLEEASRLVEDDGLRQESLRWARRSISMLEGVRNSIEKKLEDRTGRRTAEQGAGPTSVNILTAAEFRLGFAWLAVARAERDAKLQAEALQKSIERLQQYAGEWNSKPAVLEGLLALAEAHWIAGKFERSVAVLKQVQSSRTPADYRARANLLYARILLKSGDFERALEVLDVPQAKRAPGAVWDLLLVEACLRRAQEMQAHAPRQAGELKARALVVLDKLREQFGGLWGKRGDRLLAEHFTLDDASTNASRTERVAAAFREQKKFVEALKAYRQGIGAAREAKDADGLGRLAFAEAATLVESGELQPGADAFARFAHQQPEHPWAPRAQLAAAAALGAIDARQPSPQTAAAYRDALLKHRTLFPDDAPTGAEVRFRLAECEERAGKPAAAVELYRTIPPDSPRYAASIDALAGIYHDQFLGPSSQPPASAQIQRAMDDLRRIAAAAGESDSPELVKSRSAARWVLGRLAVRSSAVQQNLDPTKFLLESMGDADLTPVQRAKSAQSLLDWQVRQGKKDAALQTLQSAAFHEPRPLLPWLAGVNLESPAGPEVEAVRLVVAEAVARRLLANPQSLQAEDAYQVRLRLAQSLAGQRKHADAQRLLKQLLTEQPRDGRVVRLLARSLFEDGKFAESLELWNRLTQGSPRGGAAWLEAVSYSIDCQRQLVRRDAAAALLQMTADLYPQLGGPSLRPRFEASAKGMGIRLPAPSNSTQVR